MKVKTGVKGGQYGGDDNTNGDCDRLRDETCLG